jgi:hypothetical protein
MGSHTQNSKFWFHQVYTLLGGLILWPKESYRLLYFGALLGNFCCWRMWLVGALPRENTTKVDLIRVNEWSQISHTVSPIYLYILLVLLCSSCIRVFTFFFLPGMSMRWQFCFHSVAYSRVAYRDSRSLIPSMDYVTICAINLMGPSIFNNSDKSLVLNFWRVNTVFSQWISDKMAFSYVVYWRVWCMTCYFQFVSSM